jgi:hypothetical protein
VTVRHLRQHGVTHLLVYCADLICNHRGTLPLAQFPDDLVLLTLDSRCQCTKCRRKGADVRPDWTPQTASPQAGLQRRL